MSVKLKSLTTIVRLEEDNFAERLVDIRAYFRYQELLKYTQKAVTEEAKDSSKWEEAANYMTLTLSSGIKQKLVSEDFSDGIRC